METLKVARGPRDNFVVWPGTYIPGHCDLDGVWPLPGQVAVAIEAGSAEFPAVYLLGEVREVVDAVVSEADRIEGNFPSRAAKLRRRAAEAWNAAAPDRVYAEERYYEDLRRRRFW